MSMRGRIGKAKLLKQGIAAEMDGPQTKRVSSPFNLGQFAQRQTQIKLLISRLFRFRLSHFVISFLGRAHASWGLGTINFPVPKNSIALGNGHLVILFAHPKPTYLSPPLQGLVFPKFTLRLLVRDLLLALFRHPIRLNRNALQLPNTDVLFGFVLLSQKS